MLKTGLYENVIDSSTDNSIKEAEENGLVCLRETIESSELRSILSDYLAKAILDKLEEINPVSDRFKVINKVLSLCGINNTIVDENNLLMEVMTNQAHLLQKQSNIKSVRPSSGLRVSNLFTGGASGPLNLNEEIRRDICSAQRISLLISFLRVSGVDILIDELKRFCERGGKLRIITTTYSGVTEAKAVQQLSELPNTEMKISYNTRFEHLHAKAYIFERDSGLHTAYIGSSNLSKTAHTEGLEWNIRVTNVENPHIIKIALGTFESYWNSPNFEDFKIGGIEKFRVELFQNQNHKTADLTAFQHYHILPHQKQILDKLRVEREELNNYKNLIVAATGTGKTVISAFDYSAFRNRRKGESKRLLYVAHRLEILEQALITYRGVLQDPNFGSLWVGNYTPQTKDGCEYLFVSVSMFDHRFEDFFSELNKDFYDYIVIDEAHHSPANSYSKLFSHFTPKILIGLTATPERMDCKDLLQYFENHISAEIRLPQALAEGLLSPFRYLCISDNTDLRDGSLWNGKYIVDKLSKKLCSLDRTLNIVNALRKHIVDENDCRALCFCVDIEHAEYTAEQFRNYGLKAKSLTSKGMKEEERKKRINELVTKEINYLCVVDVFNEGVDLPEVDTVLFLRPTESLTIFLQQLGRGLRLHPDKMELTVLDFVAQVHVNFDYASRLRALSLRPEKNVEEQVKNGFNFLPPGCSIVMEEVAKQHILSNIESAIYNKARIIKDIVNFSKERELTIEDFLSSNGQEIRILYLNNHCWSALKKDANKISYVSDDTTKKLEKGMSNLLHHNTRSFLRFVLDYVNGSENYLKKEYERYAAMLYMDVYDLNGKMDYEEMKVSLYMLANEPNYSCFKQEIGEIIRYKLKHLEIITAPLGEEILSGVEVYGCYTIREITLLAEGTPIAIQSGIYKSKQTGAYLLFVTLDKSKKGFSPSTHYDNHIISEDLFHWQSRRIDSHDSKGGKVYINQKINDTKIILFVREEEEDKYGTPSFHCFGPVNYVESSGDMPMNITWKLKQPIMAQYMSKVAV